MLFDADAYSDGCDYSGDNEACVQPLGCGVQEKQLEHILIIDDDYEQVEALAYRFKKLGYRISTATTCEEGITQAIKLRPDLILLDIRLPDGDGLETCSRFSDDEATAEIPVIIVSATDDADVVRRARSAGCQYYVRKPYDPNALLTLVKSAIAESQGW